MVGTIIKLVFSVEIAKQKLALVIQIAYLKLAKAGFERKTDLELVRIGTNYGGYWMPSAIFDQFSSKSLVSLGLGFDISLDKELLSQGFKVLGLEPNKSSCEYVVNELLSNSFNQNFLLVEAAVDSSMGIKVFERPNLKSNYQWWADEMSNSSDYASVSTTQISILAKEYPEFFNSHLSILKMDIEGSEVQVLSDVIEEDLKFDFMAIEMDYLSLLPILDIYGRAKRLMKVRSLFAKLRKSGYRLVLSEGYNFFWISSSFKHKFKIPAG